MADVKISQLTGASTPLTGSEEIPLVQSGTTLKATSQDIANLAAPSIVVLGAGTLSTLRDGANNTTVGNYATSFGRCNTASGNFSSISGGYKNTASGNYSFSNGKCNTASGYASSSSGYYNTSSNYYSYTFGGRFNTATGSSSSVINGNRNNSTGNCAFIGGGRCNNATQEASVIVNGNKNTSSSCFAFTGSGYFNTTSGAHSFTGSGRYNTTSGGCSFTGSGYCNTASNYSTFVGAGACNLASGCFSGVVGGFQNTASGSRSAILGGTQNNTCGFADAMILGSCLNATQACTTFTNCVSAANLTLGCAVCVGTNSVLNNYTPAYFTKLGFNNISDYVVSGGAGTQNLGTTTLGMVFAFGTESKLYVASGGNYVFNLRLITIEQFGGVAMDIGINYIYSSAGGTTSASDIGTATYTSQGGGSNNGIQTRSLVITIPQTYLANPVNYFRFEVIASRTPVGNSSIVGAELFFNY